MDNKVFPRLRLRSTGETFSLQGRIITIGTSPSCRIRLKDKSVPATLGHFIFKNGSIQFQKLSESSVVLVNDVVINDQAILTHGDQLTISREQYIFDEYSEPADVSEGKKARNGFAGNLSEIVDCMVMLLRNRDSDVFCDLVSGVSKLLKCDAARLVIEDETGKRSTIARYPLNTGLDRFSNRAIDWACDKRETVIMQITSEKDDQDASGNSLIKNAIGSVLCGALYHKGTILGFLYLDRMVSSKLFSEEERQLCDALLPLFSEIVVSYKENIRQRATIARLQELSQGSGAGIIYDSEPMKKTIQLAARFAYTDAPMLIGGETGTGKELMARFIHEKSSRAGKTFKAINSGAIPENLIESELFGYEKGAFTGATQRKIGLFEATSEGTLFLDEIGDLPLSLQVKLLRVLQESEISRLGSTETVKVNVRIIAATHRDLSAEVTAGRFRQDLFFRLNVLTITLPPLRDRDSDIILLSEYFIKKYSQQFGLEVKRLSADAKNSLLRYGWPGNIREMENTIQKAIIKSEASTLVADDFELGGTVLPDKKPLNAAHTLKDARNAAEKEIIINTLSRTKGNVSSASALLEIDRKWLIKKMEELGIDADNYRK
jgi:transcriptional regulator with GAF, ATPase, and Fis domain